MRGAGRREKRHDGPRQALPAIGRAIVETLAREGARVIVNRRSQAAVDVAVADIQSATGADVLGFAGDLGTAAAAEALGRQYPDVDILVNNLGIFEAKPFEAMPDDDWMRFFEVNVLSGVRLARLYLPSMRQRNRGRIIFMSSESAVQIPTEMINYGTTSSRYRAVWPKRWRAPVSWSTACSRAPPSRAA